MIKIFICDVDGCLNDGKIYWSETGKPFKVFGNYDHDGLKILRYHLDIQFITADKSGWEITKSRIVDHMNFPLTLVTEKERYKFVEQFKFNQVAYMGDGIYDAAILKKSSISICPAQARIEAKSAAKYITPSKGGEGAVMDACLYILKEMGVNYEF